MVFALWLLCTGSTFGASRGEVTLIGRVTNFDSQIVAIQTEAGAALIPRRSILNPEDIAPGNIVKAVIREATLDKLNEQDQEIFGSAPPVLPPAPGGRSR